MRDNVISRAVQLSDICQCSARSGKTQFGNQLRKIYLSNLGWISLFLLLFICTWDHILLIHSYHRECILSGFADKVKCCGDWHIGMYRNCCRNRKITHPQNGFIMILYFRVELILGRSSLGWKESALGNVCPRFRSAATKYKNTNTYRPRRP